MSSKHEILRHKTRLKQRAPHLMRLEPRVMFDGAAVDTLLGQTYETEVDLYIAPPATEESAEGQVAGHTLFAITAPLDSLTQEALQQAEAAIAAFIAETDAEALFSLFSGQQEAPSEAWLAAAESLRQQILAGEFSVLTRLVGADVLGTTYAAFAASGPNGEPTIFINQDWLNSTADLDLITRVLVEEVGHAIDQVLNRDQDTQGDEGEAFAVAALKLPTNFIDEARIAIQDDHRTILVDGEEFVVETANFGFVNAYEMVYDLNNNNQIDNTERWAEKEQNTHFFNTAALGQAIIDDDTNSQYFSGNDVSAIGIKIGEETLYGWISRPIKANGIVRGFYFWTDKDFIDLATAQADGNTDGDRNVSDNRGFLLVIDQAWFDQQIASTSRALTINNLKDGDLGTIQVAAVGSSSDRVDSAINAMVVPNQAPTPTPDLFTGDAGTTITGNLLLNDTDPDNDLLSVTAFVIGGHSYPVDSNGFGSVTLAGIGSLTIYSNGVLTFVPDADFIGNVPTVTYTVSDGALTASSFLSIIVNAVNQPPTSTDDTLTIDSGKPILLSLSDFGDYSDPDQDPLVRVKIIGLPESGKFEYKNSQGVWVDVSQDQEVLAAEINAGRLRYTAQFVQDVEIFFEVSDGQLWSENSYKLEIIVNEGLPQAENLIAHPAIEGVDGQVGTPSTGSLLPDDSTLKLIFIGNTPIAEVGYTDIQGLYGTLRVRANGQYIYTPNDHHPDVDALNVNSALLTESFTYTLANTQGYTDTASLTVSIQGANDAPIAQADRETLKELASLTNGNYGQVSGNLLLNDQDVDSQSLSVVIRTSDVIQGEGSTVIETTATSPISTTTEVSFGATFISPSSLTQLGNGSNSGTDVKVNGQLVYIDGTNTPLKVWRTSGSSNYLAFNSPATALGFQSGTVFETNRNNNTIQFTLGSISSGIAPSTLLTITSGNSDQIQDGAVLWKNGAPIVINGSNVTVISRDGNVLTLSAAVAIGNEQINFVSGGAPITGDGINNMVLKNEGGWGYVRIFANGDYTYTLTDNSLNAGDVRTETFIYQVTDGDALSSQTTLTITIHGTSSVPGFSVVNDSFTVNEDQQLVKNLLTNDPNATAVTGFTWGDQVGVVGSPLTISGIGTLKVDSNGDMTFDPEKDYNGYVPAIIYTASAGGVELASATVSIRILPVNDAPVSTDDTITVAVDTPTLLTLNDFGSYSDVDGDPLAVIRITALPQKGVLERWNGSEWVAVQADDSFPVADISAGKLRYITESGAETGQSYTTINFRVNDGLLDSDEDYTLTVNVIAPPPQILAGEAPVNSVPLSPQTLKEFETLSFSDAIPISVADSDSDLASVTLSVAKGILNITAPDNNAGAASGIGSNLLVLTGTQEQINEMLQSLVYTPNAGSNGEDTLRIHSVDATNRSDTDFVSIQVAADDRTLTVAGTSVNEASPYLLFQVAGAAGQQLTLALATTGSGAGHATVGADVLPAFEYFNGEDWESYTSGERVEIPDGDRLLVRVAVLQDSLNEGVETLKLVASNTAGIGYEGIGSIRDDAQGVIYLASNTTFNANTSADSGYPAYLDDDRPVSVNNIAVNEASPFALFTVSGFSGQVLRLQLEGGTANIASSDPALNGQEDFGPALEIYNGNVWIAYTANSDVTLLGSTLLVRTAIVNDEIFEGQEGFSLAVTRVSQGDTIYGVASIYDDGTGDIFLETNSTGTANASTDLGYPELDDDRSLSMTSPAVNEASDWAIFTLTGNAGQTVVLEVINSSHNGTESGKANIPSNAAVQIYVGEDAQGVSIWENYNPNAALPTFNEAGKIFVRVSITAEQDDYFEGVETFQLKATLAQQNVAINNLGEVTVTNTLHPSLSTLGTASIYDDGTGVIFTDDISSSGPVTLTNGLDDDTPGLSLSKSSITTSEAITSDSFTLVLKSQPSSSVTITITGLDATEGSLSSTILIFTPENWNQAQTVTVTGVDDDLLDGNQIYNLMLSASSTDPDYQGKTAVVKVTNLDNEVAAPSNPQPIPEPIIPPPTTTAPAPTNQVTLPSDPLPTVNSAFNSFQPLVDNSSGLAPWEQFFSLFESSQSLGSESHQLTTERNIPDVQLGLNGEVRFTIPADTFAHTDAQALVVLTATMADGTPLPSWLRFDPVSGQLTGQAPESYRGELQVRVVARDEAGRQAETLVRVNQGSNSAAEANLRTALSNTRSAQDGLYSYMGPTTASSGFPVAVDTLGIRNGEHILKVARAIPDQLFIPTGDGLLFVIPTDAFVHSDSAAQVELDATLVDGSQLPDWLEFDPEKGEFKGTPPEGFEGELLIKVVARDQDGRQAETQVRIRITAQGQASVWMGRPGLSEQIQAQGVFAWKAERDQLIRDAILAAQSNIPSGEEMPSMPGVLNESAVAPV